MKIILKGCTEDLLDDISEYLGSQIMLDCDECGVYEDDEPIYDIELDTTKCIMYTQPEWINIIRNDVNPERCLSIADFRFEEVIIK